MLRDAVDQVFPPVAVDVYEGREATTEIAADVEFLSGIAKPAGRFTDEKERASQVGDKQIVEAVLVEVVQVDSAGVDEALLARDFPVVPQQVVWNATLGGDVAHQWSCG